MDKAIEGCEFVIHVASPVVFQSPKDEMELIGPALNGTKAVLESCLKHKVKRLIVTSSTASVVDLSIDGKKFTEDDWPVISKNIWPYQKSKILAEQSVWEFWNNLKLEEKFDIVTL